MKNGGKQDPFPCQEPSNVCFSQCIKTSTHFKGIKMETWKKWEMEWQIRTNHSAEW